METARTLTSCRQTAGFYRLVDHRGRDPPRPCRLRCGPSRGLVEIIKLDAVSEPERARRGPACGQGGDRQPRTAPQGNRRRGGRGPVAAPAANRQKSLARTLDPAGQFFLRTGDGCTLGTGGEVWFERTRARKRARRCVSARRDSFPLRAISCPVRARDGLVHLKRWMP